MGVLKGTLSSSTRKKRVHRKSRHGCRNCKLRKVKCDETTPMCKQCRDFQVSCNYDSGALDLQVPHDTVADLWISLPRACSINQTILSTINRMFSSHPHGYNLHTKDLEKLYWFQTRTIPTLGTARSVPVYQSEVLRLACTHPLVMHACMALVTKHERVVSQLPYSSPTTFELYHEHQATALLSKKLSEPLLPDDYDAIGAVGALLGAWTLASIEAPTPDRAWPLKTPSFDDLQWLKLSDGKRELLKIANHTRSESQFRLFFNEYLEQSHMVYHSRATLAKLPTRFLEYFNLKVDSSSGTNPYYKAVRSVALLRDVECDHNNCLMFFSFTSDMQQEFQDLLKQSDPRALLLMAFWYAKVCQYQWWIARRAMVECQAICIYLKRYHAQEIIIHDLLLYPMTRCGLLRHDFSKLQNASAFSDTLAIDIHF